MPNIDLTTLTTALARADLCDECYESMRDRLGDALEASFLHFNRPRWTGSCDNKRHQFDTMDEEREPA